MTPDLYGHGRTPPWGDSRDMCLDDEVDLIEPLFGPAGDRLHLIGHSWGGAIAMKAGLRYPSRVVSMVLYEPALWSLLIAAEPQGSHAREILACRDRVQLHMDGGDFIRSGECFVEYWVGPGVWESMAESRRTSIAAGMRAAGSEFVASLNEETPLRAFAALDVPVLVLTGEKSKAPAKALAALVFSILPQARLVELEGVGHMGPVTHPEKVNQEIERFLLRL